MQRLIPRAVAVLAVLPLLAACPKPAVKDGASPPVLRTGVVEATLVFHFDEIHSDLYQRLRKPSPSGVLLEELLADHDADRYTGTPTHWGSRRVIEFTDTNRPQKSTAPLAGWFLGPKTDGERETVESVLLRGFEGGPAAPSLEELLAGLQPTWEPPWELCRPTENSARVRGSSAVAYDSERGIKMGLDRSSDEDVAEWRVDHVEFFSTRLTLADFWRSKDYGSCEAIGSMSVRGQFEEIQGEAQAGE